MSLSSLVLVCLGFALLPDLGSPDFVARQTAQNRMERTGWPAIPAGVAGSYSEDPEVRWRARLVCDGWAGELADWLTALGILCGRASQFPTHWPPYQLPHETNGWDTQRCTLEVYARIGAIAYLVGSWPRPDQEADWPIWRANWMVRDTLMQIWGK